MNARRQDQAGATGNRPVRTCIVSRAQRPPQALIRFALAPDNTVVPDLATKLPGRGAWVTNARSCLDQAVARKAFDRAWRRQVKVGEDLADQVDALLIRRALQQLSLANKAGCVITGYTNVDQRIMVEPPPWLVQAADAGADGRERLARKYGAICRSLQIAPLIIDLFSVEQISLAIGRPNVVHAAVHRARAAAGFAAATRRILSFRGIGQPLPDSASAVECVKSPSEKANDVM